MCDVPHFRFYGANTRFPEFCALWPLFHDVHPKFPKVTEDIHSMNKPLQISPFSFPWRVE